MKLRIASLFALTIFISSCSLNIAPFDGVTSSNLASVPNALVYATNGTYSMMKDMLPYKGTYDYRSSYERNLHMLLEYPGDNVTLSGTTTDPLFFAATREHYPAMENTNYVWYVGYKIINLANQNIESAAEGTSTSIDYLLGENYFMRAMAEFDMLRLFAKQYSLGVSNPGIVLRLSGSTPDALPRSTVGESYDQVVKDLLKAAALMDAGTSRGIEYASKEAAWALLSRVYLYMEQNASAIEYATKVINSDRFTLATADTYLDLFHDTGSSAESIFIIKNLIQDDLGLGSIGSMYLTDGIGWGEVYISGTLRTLMKQHPEDVRNTLIKPQYEADGTTVANRNGVPKLFITKFSYQDGIVTLSSPHVLRLAEMYLNRAEASAKTNDNATAISDINVIRARAGLSGSALYSTGNLQGAATVLDAVLQERRLELAYEGHRSIDVARNKQSLNRVFPGVQPQVVVPYDDPSNIYLIPQDEMIANTACIQNAE